MEDTNNTPKWEFSFSAANQPREKKTIYVKALNYLKTLDIDVDLFDQTEKGWKQMKMMFTEEDREALQTFIDNSTITP